MKKSNLVTAAVLAVVAAGGAGTQLVSANNGSALNSASEQTSIFVTSNPNLANAAGDAILGFDKKLNAEISRFATFGNIRSIQSIEHDSTDRAFVTFDDTAPATGGVFVVEDVDSVTTTRTITGPTAGLIQPKGVEIVKSQKAVIISDAGAAASTAQQMVGSVKVFADTASGDAAPLFSLSGADLGNRSPWDADYDDASDTLFVATQQGDLLVYENFFANQGSSAPTKVVTPAMNGSKVSVNLHGAAYNSETDSIVLSDVVTAAGAAAATDGILFTISNLSAKSGLTGYDARIAGANTRLGNPVDVDLKGGRLFVAEKANAQNGLAGVVMRFDGIFDYRGDVNVAADEAVNVRNPESVSVN